MREAEIQAAIRKDAGTIPDIVVFRNNVGMTGHSATCPRCGHVQSDDEDGPRVRYGLCRGSSDLIFIMYPMGRFGACELKVPGRKPTAEQEMFLDLIRRRGGFAFVAHSVEEFRAGIERCRAGLSE